MGLRGDLSVRKKTVQTEHYVNQIFNAKDSTTFLSCYKNAVSIIFTSTINNSSESINRL